jgi:hypothetical protein
MKIPLLLGVELGIGEAKLSFHFFFDDYLSLVVQFAIQPECSVR